MTLGGLSLLLIKKGKNQDYSYWSKLLHSIVLDNYNLGKYLLNRELKRIGRNDNYNSSFVIVTGLARAGTTALTNLIYEEGTFHSIKYSNMPFLLAPNFWKRVYNPKLSSERERSHGDKVLFSENSIEALEEYFFKVALNDKYIAKDSLTKHEINWEQFEMYLKYQQLFKYHGSKKTIYLAKNNNFLLRYEGLRKLNKEFIVILIFRNPVEHAESLLHQHQNFVKKQTEDDFVLDYMNWLGHYEFGLNQKYFDLGSDKIWEPFEKYSANYWVAMWINYYSYLIQFLSDPKLILVNYNDLAERPKKLKSEICKSLNIYLNVESVGQYKSKRPNILEKAEIDETLKQKADELYEILKSHQLNIKREF